MNLKDIAYNVNLTLYAFSKEQDFSKVRIAVIGKWEGHINGIFEMDNKTLENIVSCFNNQNIDIVCDYEHQTITTTEGSAPASGWVKSLLIENDSLYAFVEWTEKAKELINNKEYKYVSPVFQPNTIDRITGNNIGWTLHSLALTNRPFLEELGEVFLNSKDELFSLKRELKESKEKVILLSKELETKRKEEINNIIDLAIKENKLKEEQREYAFKIACEDLSLFQNFIANNNLITIPPNNLFLNTNHNNMIKSDIELMIEVASKQ